MAVILITGANQGLGYETLKVLARSPKHKLIVAARSQQKSEEAIARILRATGASRADFTPVVIDLASDESIFSAAKIVEYRFGFLDVLVNNAGINRSPDDEASLREDYRAVFDTNVFGVAVMNEAFLPLLRASTHPRRRIVTVTSGLGMFGVATREDSPYNIKKFPVVPVYRASKSAVNMLSVYNSLTLREEGIGSVLVEPGYCRTAFGGFQGDKEAEDGGKVIARAAVEGENEDLLLKVVDDEGKFDDFGW